MKKLWFSCCSAALVIADVHAETIALTCPAFLAASSIQFTATPAGWTPHTPAPLEVRTADLLFGPPASGQIAESSSFKESKSRTVATWELAALPTEPKWLRCGYGAAIEITLSKQLPTNVSSCTITSIKDADGNVTSVEAKCTLGGK